MSNKTSRHGWFMSAVRSILSLLIKLPLRLVAGLSGLFLMICGSLLTVTIIGAPVGIPIAVVGLLLVVRSIF